MRKLFLDKLPILIVGVVSVFLIVAVFLCIEKWDENQGSFPEQEVTDPTIEHNGTSYIDGGEWVEYANVRSSGLEIEGLKPGATVAVKIQANGNGRTIIASEVVEWSITLAY